jgi:uncharacterized protein
LIIVVSPDSIAELQDTAQLPRIRKVLDPGELAGLVLLLQKATIVDPPSIEAVCRDPNDDYLLALAKTSDADILVTRDEDLLVLGRYGRTEIVYPAEFLRRLSQETA